MVFIIFWYCLAINSVKNFKKYDVASDTRLCQRHEFSSGQLTNAIAEIQQFILTENAFPTRQEQQMYLEKIISKYSQKDDVSDLKSRVCILYLVYLAIIWISADISFIIFLIPSLDARCPKLEGNPKNICKIIWRKYFMIANSIHLAGSAIHRSRRHERKPWGVLRRKTSLSGSRRYSATTQMAIRSSRRMREILSRGPTYGMLFDTFSLRIQRNGNNYPRKSSP